jgi:hypothetical protein
MKVKYPQLFVIGFCLLLFFGTYSFTCQAQIDDEFTEDDLSVEGDIFNDFNEDLEASQVLEDERFYRYGRFFQAAVGLGLTTFTGNRGLAYEDNHPTFHLSTVFFMGFHSAIVLGVEYSKHTMFVDTSVQSSRDKFLGAVETAFTRPFLGFRHYLDTSDLGTAITYSNPYFLGRLEYWYQQNKFINQPERPRQQGGGIGLGLGAGLEFPVELKVSYISVELLYHQVNFFDRYTTDYQQIPASENPTPPSTYGYNDLEGASVSLMVTYNFTW